MRTAAPAVCCSFRRRRQPSPNEDPPPPSAGLGEGGERSSASSLSPQNSAGLRAPAGGKRRTGDQRKGRRQAALDLALSHPYLRCRFLSIENERTRLRGLRGALFWGATSPPDRLSISLRQPGMVFLHGRNLLLLWVARQLLLLPPIAYGHCTFKLQVIRSLEYKKKLVAGCRFSLLGRRPCFTPPHLTCPHSLGSDVIEYPYGSERSNDHLTTLCLPLSTPDWPTSPVVSSPSSFLSIQPRRLSRVRYGDDMYPAR